MLVFFKKTIMDDLKSIFYIKINVETFSQAICHASYPH